MHNLLSVSSPFLTYWFSNNRWHVSIRVNVNQTECFWINIIIGPGTIFLSTNQIVGLGSTLDLGTKICDRMTLIPSFSPIYFFFAVAVGSRRSESAL